MTILGVFKYHGFFIESFSSIVECLGGSANPRVLAIVLPVGISFYTFQTMSYTIDIYGGEMEPTRNFIDLANYVSFFPQLVAGPIERAGHLLPQISRFNGINPRHVVPGLTLMLTGYAKKVLIADKIAPIVDGYFSSYADLGSAQLAATLVLFSVQIYFDFSGYVDIARGLARLFGIELSVNFDQPYLSAGVREFWRRWHISLSTWLRDYLYIPLGGNRKGRTRTYINLMLTMLLGGLWHGASWNFVVWGAPHGLYLVIAGAWGRGRPSTSDRLLVGRILRIVFTYALVTLTWLPFRLADLSDVWLFAVRLFTLQGQLAVGPVILAGFMLLVVLVADLPAYFLKDHLYLLRLPRWLFIPILVVGYCAIVLALTLHTGEARPFIYFQF